jgi:LuxR family maltose regulon positive regulatory protein
MAAPLVATKLFVPTLRAGSIRRPRLSDRLERGGPTRLVLVSAPAGFGKSTLLAEWLAAPPAGRVAFLALDRTDDDPVAFWSHLATALRDSSGAGAAVAEGARAGMPPDEAALAALLNELGALPHPVEIVLDDYHLVDRAEIHRGVAFLLERLPPNARLLIATRVDPPLPLARLRAQGELVEVRSADLRFTAGEASAYLNGTMGLGLSPANLTALGDRTEGWIAALQLAALSLDGRDDVAGFIAGFTGNDRYVFDYLVEEVLQRQRPEVRSFLLRTSILERIGGPLCDAVLGSGGSAAMLAALHRQNLFLVPLDDRRQWYRYHHLFAEVLQAHLADEAPGDLPALHGRASAWLAAAGELAPAIRHALAGGDFERAAGMIAGAIPELRRARREVVIRDWLRALPDPLVRSRPNLAVGLAGALLANGEFADADRLLADAEGALAAEDAGGTGPGTAEGDEADQERRRLPAQIELYRAAMAQVRGDAPAMLASARRALDRALPGDHLGEASASGLIGIAHWTLGGLAAAQDAWAVCIAGLGRAGHVSDALGATVALADIAATRGRLREAATAYETGLRHAATAGGTLRGAADLHAGLAALEIERGDVDAARTHLARSRELGERAGLGPYRYRLALAEAALSRAEGNVAGALDHLAEAGRVYVGDFFPDVRPVAAVAARVRIAAGQIEAAARWRRESGVGAEDDLSFLREYEHLTLARLLLAEAPAAGVARRTEPLPAFLDRLGEAAERGGRVASVVDVAILRALAAGSRNEGRALDALAPALDLAEPEGWVRPFVDGGGPMADLLRAALRRGLAAVFVRELLAAFAPSRVAAPPRGGDAPEPLSERELDVLRLLRTDLDGPAIADELMVSLNTLRTHTRKIYEKLGVNSRRAAVRRAEELNLAGRRSGR